MKHSFRLISCGLIVLLFFPMAAGSTFWKNDDDSFYIALVAPVSGEKRKLGNDMVQAVRFFEEDLNRDGGINGKKLKLTVYDDRNDASRAAEIAQKIGNDQKTLMVIGHYSDKTSFAGGKIYEQAGIPAITASATSNHVTSGNQWYFRLIYNNGYQARFIANYIMKVLKKEHISIVYDKESYGVSLADDFEFACRSIGLFIRHKWGFDSRLKNIKMQLDDLVNEIKSQKDTDAVFLATKAKEGAEIVTSLKYPGRQYTLFGPDAFASKAFIDHFKMQPIENIRPGYYSNGVYAVSPLIMETAGQKAQIFYLQYLDKYGETPSWISSGYYDAVSLAAEAIRNTSADKGKKTIEQKRRAIRDYLLNLHRPEDAIEGTKGPIYFDETGDVVQSIPVGIYNKRRLIPASIQLQPARTINRADDMTQSLISEQMLQIDQRYMYKTNIVYTGIDIMRIEDLDIKEKTYFMDFYLWFRYQDPFDQNQIEFINAAEDISLGQPIVRQETENCKTLCTYRIQGDFRSSFALHDYPFDRQTLDISLRHRYLTRNHLVFVPDYQGIRQFDEDDLAERLKRANILQNTNWELTKAWMFQNVIQNESTLGIPSLFDKTARIEYSKFNLSLQIERHVFSFLTKNLFIVILLIFLCYLIYFFSPTETGTRTLLCVNTILTSAFQHIRLASELPDVGYLVAIEYFFFVVYFLGLLGIIITLFCHIYTNRNMPEKAERINQFGKIVYPIIVVFTVYAMTTRYLF